MDKDKAPLYNLAISDSLWERRIAILSTFHFIENNDFKDTLKMEVRDSDQFFVKIIR